MEWSYPFLAALDFPNADETQMPLIDGDSEQVRIDVCQTSYNNFMLLRVPERRHRRTRVPIA